MDYRTLGKSGVKVTPVALGAWAIGGWQWGGQDDHDSIDAIHQAIDLGMTTIDTAPVYGFGHSEEIVGRAVKGRRDQVQILTKFGLRWDLPKGAAKGAEKFESRDLAGRPVTITKYAGADGVFQECEASLRRLGTDVIDLYQQHWPDASTPLADTMGACARLLEQGKIRAVGVSNFGPEELEEARKIVPIASNQPPYSMLRRGIEADVIPYCRRHGIGLLAYSPLQNGILTGKVTMDRTFPDDDLRSANPYYARENRRRILDFIDATLRPIAEAHDATVAQVVLAWTMHRPGITAALAGCRNAGQARDNAGAAAIHLTGDETGAINAALDNLELDV
jgi:aryl-alcohol dehydrogenase-like predicted oxidoreductase